MNHTLPTELIVRQLKSSEKVNNLLVYIIVGCEHYRSQNEYSENITENLNNYDYVNWAWRNYGNTTGIFNLLELLNSYNACPSIMINTDMYKYNYKAIEMARKINCEFVCHGKSNSESLSDFYGKDQIDYINNNISTVLKNEKRKKIGWSGPWLLHNEESLINLSNSDMSYLLELRIADVPVYISNKNRSIGICALPYSIELNDSASIIERKTPSELFYKSILDEIEFYYERINPDRHVVISIVLHDFISGVPFRLNLLEKLLIKITNEFEKISFVQPEYVYNLFRGDI